MTDSAARIEAAKARLRYAGITARKMRLVADLIRGKTVAQAQRILKFTVKPSAVPHVERLLKSAVANARQNEVGKPEELIVGDVQVGVAPILKRWRPRAYGRAARIKKRMSHLTIVLLEKR